MSTKFGGCARIGFGNIELPDEMFTGIRIPNTLNYCAERNRISIQQQITRIQA